MMRWARRMRTGVDDDMMTSCSHVGGPPSEHWLQESRPGGQEASSSGRRPQRASGGRRGRQASPRQIGLFDPDFAPSPERRQEPGRRLRDCAA